VTGRGILVGMQGLAWRNKEDIRDGTGMKLFYRETAEAVGNVGALVISGKRISRTE